MPDKLTPDQYAKSGWRLPDYLLDPVSHEEIKDAKAWDGDVVELQLAHLDNSTVEGLYKKHGPLALIGSRTKLMQHWADRIDDWLDPRKVEARMLESPNIRLVNVALFSRCKLM